MTYQGFVNEKMRYGAAVGRTYTRTEPQRQSRRPAMARGISSEETARRSAVQSEAMRRREAAESARRRRHEAELRRVKAYQARLKREEKEARLAEKAEIKKARRAEEAELLRREIKVEKKKLSVSFVAMVLTAFVLLMGVVFSYAQIAESGAELSEAKAKYAAIEKETAELEIALEHKNDITLIEDLAMNEYMMVREDSVQKKYVSASVGDRIILDDTESESDDSSGFMGSVLSSFSSAFDDILDYFR